MHISHLFICIPYIFLVMISRSFKSLSRALSHSLSSSLSVPAYVLVIHINCSHSFEWVNYSAHCAFVSWLLLPLLLLLRFFFPWHSPPLLVAGAAVAFFMCIYLSWRFAHLHCANGSYLLPSTVFFVFFLLVLHCISLGLYASVGSNSLFLARPFSRHTSSIARKIFI